MTAAINAGSKILDGLRDALSGNFAAVTIEGQRWIRAPETPVLYSDSYNDGFTHEALHTTFVLMETFSDHVIETRCADEFPDVKAAAEKSHQALFDLYQLIGSKMP